LEIFFKIYLPKKSN